MSNKEKREKMKEKRGNIKRSKSKGFIFYNFLSILILVVGLVFLLNILLMQNNFENYNLSLIEKVYSNFVSGNIVSFLSENQEQIKILEITKDYNYSGKIYDLTVDNHIILVKGKNSFAMWSGNCYDGVGQIASTTGKFMQFQTNLYTNTTEASPFLLNHSISNIPDLVPNGTLISPSNGSYVNNATQNFTANISDSYPGIANATLTIVNASNTTQIVNQTTQTFVPGTLTTTIGIVVTLFDNIFNWFYQIFDLTGNSYTTENRTVTIDTTYPLVNFIYPTPSNNSGRAGIFDINISITELNLVNITLNFNGTIEATCNTTSVVGSNCNNVNATFYNTSSSDWIFLMNRTGLSPVLYYYFANVTDRANNKNSTEIRWIRGNTPPVINFTIPTTFTGNYSRTEIIANVTITDAENNLNYTNITLYNSTSLINSTYDASSSSLINVYLNYSNLAQGRYYLNATAADTPGDNSNSSTYVILLDTTNPGIIENTPINEYYSNSSSINLTTNITDNFGIANATLYVYNLTSLANQTTTNFASDTLASNLGITVNLSDNNYTWFYETYDWPGNYNFTANRTLIIDTIRPLISFNSSLTYSTLVNVSRNNIPIGIDYTETNFANLTFNLYNATYNGIGFVNLTLVNSTLITDSTKFINFTNLADNYYFYNATIVDRANNKNSTETRLILLDTTNPNGTLISPLNNSYLAYLNVNLTANVSDNLGLANATLYVYNSSGGLFNSTIIIFAQGTTQTTIGVVVSFIEGIYTWFYQLFDWASNPFTTNNNTVIVDTIAPSMINIVYSPDTNNSIDPGTFMQFNVTVRDTTSGVNAVVLQVYNGSVWSNSSMSRISGTIYDGTWIANITTSLAETNYGFKIYSNDTSNNSVTSSRYNFSNYWDCTWNATTSLDAKAGYSETKNLGQITITNLGDSNYSEQCLLAFVTEHNLESGKMTLNSNNKRTTYTLTAGQTKNINVSYRFDLDPRSDSYIITHTESLVQNPSQINTTGTAVTSQAGPYLYQTISSYPSIVYIRPQTLSITSYISNLMGSSTYNETNTAFNVSSNWTISSQFTNLTGNFSNFFGNISDSDSHSLDLGLNATNWKTLPQGIYTLTLFSSGVDYNGTYIRDTNNNSNFTDSKNITVLCYPFADGFDASSCWPTDPDTVYCGNGKIDTTFGSNETCDDGNAISGDGCSLYCLVESGYSCSGVPSTCSAIGTGGTGGTGSSGGGGGGSSSNQKIEKSEATFELVRGEKQEFEFEIKNKYSGEMKNTKISVSGLNSQYIKLYPTEISSIKAGESAKIKVTISAPAYFTGKTYTLVFDISSIVNIDNKTYSLLDRKSVNLYLLEVPRKEANTMVNESERFVQEMKESGMILNQVQEILDNMKALYSNISFTELKKDFEALKQIYEDAFNSKALIEELKANIAQKTKEGVSTLETQGILFLGEAAYARGDYALSIKTLEDAKRAYATEVKGEFNILYAIKNNPMQSLGILLGASVFGIGSSLVIRYRLYKKRLKILGEEEILLLELMKVVQKECFENNKMSMEEYENAMMQYEHKLSETISDKIRTETKIANMFRISGKRLALEDEKKRLVSMIKKIQDDYLNKGKLETRIYENALNSYTARLGDVEEQMAFLDAQDALKKQTKIKRMFKV